MSKSWINKYLVMTISLDGHKVASKVYEDLRPQIKVFEEMGTTPKMAIILTTDDSRSIRYAEMKKEKCRENKISATIFKSDKEEKIAQIIKTLNTDEAYHGVFIQLPINRAMSKYRLLNYLSPSKDIDCMTPENLGRLLMGNERYVPANVAAIFRILNYYKIDTREHWGILGINNVVGKPLMCKLCTLGLSFEAYKKITRLVKSKIVVSDIQEKASIKSEHLMEDSIIIDNGNNYSEGKVYGDVYYNRVKDSVSAITPVPGGIGPATIAMLVKNLVTATNTQQGIKESN